jgi:hypothetical protein
VQRDIYPLADLCCLARRPIWTARPAPLLDDPDSAWDRPVFAGHALRRSRPQRLFPSWRYTGWENGKQGVELYDHDLDPLEMQNLAGRAELAQTQKELTALLPRK